MLSEIETANNRIHMDRLINRRDRIMARIRTIDDQLNQLAQNPLIYDENGEPQHGNLLTYLSSFHRAEVDQLDHALNRLASGQYGLCLACRGQMEAIWLESFPEAEFCSTCYRIRERMAAG
jgi:RNA polymerase-binding transcription factor DksA